MSLPSKAPNDLLAAARGVTTACCSAAGVALRPQSSNTAARTLRRCLHKSRTSSCDGRRTKQVVQKEDVSGRPSVVPARLDNKAKRTMQRLQFYSSPATVLLDEKECRHFIQKLGVGGGRFNKQEAKTGA